MKERCPTCHRSIKQDRSNNQNRYYWGVVINMLSEHTGFTPSEMHEVLKYRFLSYPRILISKTPEKVLIAKSTTNLTTKEFEEFMTRVRQWASIDLGLWIPEPNQAPMEE